MSYCAMSGTGPSSATSVEMFLLISKDRKKNTVFSMDDAGEDF